MRKLRVICSDPYATDSSSDVEEARNKTVKRIVYEINLEQELTRPESPKELEVMEKLEVEKKLNINEKVVKNLEMKEKVAVRKNKKRPYPGVFLRSSGRWTAKIRNRVTRKVLYLGTFDTAEAAHEAYCAKKLEFRGTVPKEKKSPLLGAHFYNGHWRSEIGYGGKRFRLGSFETAEAAHEAYCAKKRELEKEAGFNKKTKKSPYIGVHLDRGRWRSEIYFGGNHFYVGRFETAEAAHEAYRAKKRELEKKAVLSKNGKAGSGEDTDPICCNLRTRKRAFCYDSSSCKSNSCIGCCGSHKRVGKKTKLSLFTKTLDSQFCNGSMIELGPSDFKFNQKSVLGEKAVFQEEEKAAFDYGYGSIPKEMASLIIDDNGFLLGEYSQIDDLSIC